MPDLGRLQSIRYRRERGTTPRPEDVDWLLERLEAAERGWNTASEDAHTISHERDDALERVAVLEQELSEIAEQADYALSEISFRDYFDAENAIRIICGRARALAVDGTPEPTGPDPLNPQLNAQESACLRTSGDDAERRPSGGKRR